MYKLQNLLSLFKQLFGVNC